MTTLNNDYSRLHEDRNCQYCGTRFNNGSNSRQKYCNDKCNHDSYIERKSGVKPIRRSQIDSIADKLFTRKSLTEDTLPESSQRLTTNYSKLLRVLVFAGTLFSFSFCNTPSALAQPSFNKIADAIFIAEGVHSQHPYGILAKYKHTSPRQACLNTIKHQYRNWMNAGAHGDFISYLQKVYAPVGAKNDPTNLNRNWKHNVEALLK